MSEEQQVGPTNAADETDRVNDQVAEGRPERPESLSTQRAHEKFEALRDDQSVAVDERVPQQPLNPTVTRDQPVTEPARFGRGHRIGEEESSA